MSGYRIVLPNGRRCSVAVYVAAWKQLKLVKPDTSVRGFGDWPASAGDVLAELRRGLDDRINRHDPHYGRGRKWDHDWQRHALQTAQAANTPRLAIYYIMPDFRARLAHRLTALED